MIVEYDAAHFARIELVQRIWPTIKLDAKTPRDPLPHELAQRTARRHGLTVEELLSHSRVRHLIKARAELYRALRALGWSYPAIGKFCGGRDHTTILLAIAPPERRERRARLAKTRWAAGPDPVALEVGS